MCTRCGDFGCAACVFTSVKGRAVCVTCAAKGLGRPIAWERRRELGYRKAFLATVREVLEGPTRFHRTPATEEGAFSALGFGVLSWTVGLVLTYLVNGLLWLISGGVMSAMGPRWESLGLMMVGMGAFTAFLGPLAALFLGPANAIFGIVLTAACAHGLLAVFKRTRTTFEHTLRAVSYASAPYVWSFLPLLGTLTYLWVIGQEVIAVRETHQCGTDWAVASVITHRIILGVLLVGFYALFIVMGLSMGPPVR